MCPANREEDDARPSSVRPAPSSPFDHPLWGGCGEASLS